MAAKYLQQPDIDVVAISGWYEDFNYFLKSSSFCPKNKHIVISAVNITIEKMNGGLCRAKIDTSIINNVVNIGWSMSIIRIFFNI